MDSIIFIRFYRSKRIGDYMMPEAIEAIVDDIQSRKLSDGYKITIDYGTSGGSFYTYIMFDNHDMYEKGIALLEYGIIELWACVGDEFIELNYKWYMYDPVSFDSFQKWLNTCGLFEGDVRQHLI